MKDEYEDSSYHLIGVIDNKIIACGRLHFNSDNEAQIRYMAIDEHYQRRGIGVKVIELLEAEAKKRRINKIVLNARNHVIEFYKKSGYKAVRKLRVLILEFLIQLWKKYFSYLFCLKKSFNKFALISSLNPNLYLTE